MSSVDIDGDEHVYSGEFSPDEHDGYGCGKSRRKRGEEAELIREVQGGPARA